MDIDAIRYAAGIIRQGGVVAYPTEAVFGLGCDPHNLTAVRRILKLKQRDADKGLILIAASKDQLTPFVASIDAEQWQAVLATWPGPFTWLMPASQGISTLLTGDHSTLAVRVTGHPAAARLAAESGTALVSTSANTSGQPAAISVRQVKRYFGKQLDFILDAPVGDRKGPSEIRDALSGTIIRSG